MAIYDGNQLPESPTSKFQMVVSVAYTLLAFGLMGYGALAVLAAQEVISSELHATQYMRRLVRKRNAIVRGMLAFIPATFSLGHLYTSSMHNGSLYGASNVFYVAIFAFATSYLGGALKQVVADSSHMDTTKAVHEVLYFFCRYGAASTCSS
jgi:fatty acid desaturase